MATLSPTMLDSDRLLSQRTYCEQVERCAIWTGQQSAMDAKAANKLFFCRYNNFLKEKKRRRDVLFFLCISVHAPDCSASGIQLHRARPVYAKVPVEADRIMQLFLFPFFLFPFPVIAHPKSHCPSSSLTSRLPPNCGQYRGVPAGNGVVADAEVLHSETNND